MLENDYCMQRTRLSSQDRIFPILEQKEQEDKSKTCKYSKPFPEERLPKSSSKRPLGQNQGETAYGNKADSVVNSGSPTHKAVRLPVSSGNPDSCCKESPSITKVLGKLAGESYCSNGDSVTEKADVESA